MAQDGVSSDSTPAPAARAGLRVLEVVIDCAEHSVVVDFWSAALGWQPRVVNEQYVMLVPPAGTAGPPLLFQKVPEPKTIKNRVHLDFGAGAMVEDEVARPVGLGASVVARRSLGSFGWTVMEDPEGNEFCVSGR